MSNIWFPFPLPVANFLRRLVNVLSSLSITHHYLFVLPPRSTAESHKNAEFLLSSSPWAGRVLLYQNRPWRQEADSHALPWAKIVENGLLDRILQGMNFFWLNSETVFDFF
jgi:hypothetical protein